MFGKYLLSMSADEQKLWNMDGKVVCLVKGEETENQLHLLSLAESDKHLTVGQIPLEAGENEGGWREKIVETRPLRKQDN